MMLERDAAIQAVAVLSEEDFAVETHRIVFSHLSRLIAEDKAVDMVILSAEMGPDLDKIGGAVTLAGIAGTVPTAANIEHYVGIVKERSLRRKLAGLAGTIDVNVHNPEMPTDDILASAQDKLLAIVSAKPTKALDAKDLMQIAMAEAEAAHSHGGLRGISTGLKSLDRRILGLGQGQFIVIAGRPSMGKTAFALHLTREAAVRQQVGTVLFSLEMGQEELATRMLAAETKIDLEKIRGGRLGDKEWREIGYVIGRLSEGKYLIETTVQHVNEVQAVTRKYAAQKQIGLIIVDFLQQLMGPRDVNRNEEVGAISRSLKRLAMSLKIPVVALAQLSRAVEEEKPPIPRLRHLRESGEIEQAADVVIFLYREDYYDQKSAKKNLCELIIAKQRNGPTGSVEVGFDKATGRFWDLERSEPA